MSEKFAEIKKQLLKERQELLQDVSNSYEACREIGQDGVPDIGDMSSATYSRDILFNVLAGVMAVTASVALGWARRRGK